MIFQQFFKILSDPFFWVITGIFCSLGYLIYRYFVVENMSYDEEQAQLAAQLQHYGFQFIEGERQSVIEENTAQYSVKAAQSQSGKEVNFTARIQYENSEMIAVQWEPSFEEASL